MSITGFRRELVEHLAALGMPSTNSREYKDVFVETLEMMDEMDAMGDSSGLSAIERERVNHLFLEIERVRHLPNGDQLFFPSQLYSASEWQGMRDIARKITAELSSSNSK